jgi:hypothetical protein
VPDALATQKTPLFAAVGTPESDVPAIVTVMSAIAPGESQRVPSYVVIVNVEPIAPVGVNVAVSPDASCVTPV